MAILIVGGSHRGVGKTALVCGLIAGLPDHRWIAVKITSDDHDKPTSIWEETEAGQGTDTARYLAAGAGRAFLVTASDGEMLERLAELGRILGRDNCVIYESNRVVDFVRPDLCLVVDRGGEQGAKPSYARIAALADAMVSRGGADSQREEIVPAGSGAARLRFQLVGLESISAQMLEWVRERISGLHNSG
jgi:hypothetical protein